MHPLSVIERKILHRLAYEGARTAYDLNRDWRSKGKNGRYQTINKKMRTLKANGLVEVATQGSIEHGSKPYRLTLDGLIVLLDIESEIAQTEEYPREVERVFDKNADILPPILRAWKTLRKSNWELATRVLSRATGLVGMDVAVDVRSQLPGARKPGVFHDLRGRESPLEDELTKELLLPSINDDGVLQRWFEILQGQEETRIILASFWDQQITALEAEINRQKDRLERLKSGRDSLLGVRVRDSLRQSGASSR